MKSQVRTLSVAQSTTAAKPLIIFVLMAERTHLSPTTPEHLAMLGEPLATLAERLTNSSKNLTLELTSGNHLNGEHDHVIGDYEILLLTMAEIARCMPEHIQDEMRTSQQNLARYADN